MTNSTTTLKITRAGLDHLFEAGIAISFLASQRNRPTQQWLGKISLKKEEIFMYFLGLRKLTV